jgi:hypothetical protein
MLTLFYTFLGFGDSCFACDGSSTTQLFNIVNGNLVFIKFSSKLLPHSTGSVTTQSTVGAESSCSAES